MSETKEFNTLPVLSEVQEERERAQKRTTIASVRNSPGPYIAFASVITFVAALALRAHQDAVALILIGAAWLIVPVIALSDRIAFDGASLRRQGPLASLLHVFGYRKQLAIDDFETVETQAVRTLRRGGRVRYRYRTQITGKGKEFVIVSGGRDYRKLVRELFPLIHECKLDNRSRDLRDYLNDPRFLNRKTQLSQLAPSDLLDVTRPDFKLGRKLTHNPAVPETAPTPEELERALLLRRLGNELRVSGRLREAGEAFRRALNVRPHGAWLIYDFARLLRSQASAQADALAQAPDHGDAAARRVSSHQRDRGPVHGGRAAHRLDAMGGQGDGSPAGWASRGPRPDARPGQEWIVARRGQGRRTSGRACFGQRFPRVPDRHRRGRDHAAERRGQPPGDRIVEPSTRLPSDRTRLGA